ncbi:MAG: LamG domain-containing protein [Candidatus Electryoneaceae bacterium]|nr:LamG domain-containing protein [Candidatus Electryoneaceae bacterium]
MRTLKWSIIVVVVIIVVGWSHPWGQSDAPWGRSSVNSWSPVNISDCIGYWPLGAIDEITGPATVDYSGYDNHGDLPNGAGYGTDRFSKTNRAVVFDGVNDYVDTNDDIISTTAISVSVWVRVGAFGSYVITNGKCILRFTGDGYLAFSSDGVNNLYSASLSLNTWYHLLITRDAGGVGNIYIDGVQSGVVNGNTGAPEIGTVDIYIGASADISVYYDGKMQDVSLYNRVISASERTKLYTGDY